MRLRARNSNDGARDAASEVRGHVELFARTLERVLVVPRQPERLIEVVFPLPAFQQAVGLESLEVRQVAEGGEAEDLQEFLRRDIGERRAGLRGADARRRSGRGA